MSRIKVENIRHPDGTDDNISLTDTGRVGIGVASPAERLTIEDGTNVVGGFGALAYNSYSNEGLGLTFGASNDGSRIMAIGVVDTNKLAITGREGIVFTGGGAGTYAGTSEIARFDDAGRLLVGTSTSADAGSTLQVASTSFGIAELFRTGSFGGSLHIGSTGSGTLASPSALVNNEAAGYVTFRGYDSAAWRSGANIAAHADGQTWASGDCPTRLVFSVTADGASSPTERMRITNDGIVDLGHGGGQARFRTNATSQHQFSRTSTATTNLQFIEFGRAGTAPGNYTPEGDIRTNGSGNLAFSNASDITLKENIRNLDNCLETVNSLRPVLFDWKESVKAGCTDVKGFIAQEFEQVLPKSVSTDENGLKSIAPETELLPLLVGALQEALAKIETLETQNASFEARLTALEGGQP